MALVCIQNGNQCVRTDEGGNYILHDVTATQHTLEVTASQYFFVEKPISVEPGENVTQHFALSPPLEEGDLRIVLTWGETPTDLDSHLHLQAGEESYLINYNEKGAKELLPFAILDVDDLDSFGPETITIQELVDGTYIYAVHNYSGDDTFLNADIRVEVYNDTEMVVEFTPTGEQNGRWWHVFDMNSELGTAVITEVNQIQDEMPEELSR